MVTVIRPSRARCVGNDTTPRGCGLSHSGAAGPVTSVAGLIPRSPSRYTHPNQYRRDREAPKQIVIPSSCVQIIVEELPDRAPAPEFIVEHLDPPVQAWIIARTRALPAARWCAISSRFESAVSHVGVPHTFTVVPWSVVLTQ
jgi:hypothetical protein